MGAWGEEFDEFLVEVGALRLVDCFEFVQVGAGPGGEAGLVAGLGKVVVGVGGEVGGDFFEGCFS